MAEQATTNEGFEVNKARKLNDLDRDGVADHLAGSHADPRMERLPPFEYNTRHGSREAVGHRDIGEAMRGFTREGDTELRMNRADKPAVTLAYKDPAKDTLTFESPQLQDLHKATEELQKAEDRLDAVGHGDGPDRELATFDKAVGDANAHLAERYPARYTVQQQEQDTAEYRNVLTTDNALEADSKLQDDKTYRVVDNQLGVVAADHPIDKDTGRAEEFNPRYHEQSNFGQEVRSELDEQIAQKEHAKQADMDAMLADPEHMAAAKAHESEQLHSPGENLQRGLDKADRKQADMDAMLADPEHMAAVKAHESEQLQNVLREREAHYANVAEKSEAIAFAVDGSRQDSADMDAVAKSYHAAAMAYAAAVQEQQAFEAKPHREPEVVADYRELQRLEKAITDHEQAEAHARIDGDEKARQAASNMGLAVLSEREVFLKARNIAPDTPIPERSNNVIERGLSDEQIQAMMNPKPAKAASTELDDEARAAGVAASDKLKAMNITEGHNQVRDNSAFNDAQAKDRIVPDDVAAAYKRDGQKYLDANDPEKVAFVDKGNRLQTKRTFDDKAVADMIEVADARGWSELKVTGDEAFRRKAWVEATARGIEVKGYEPTDRDKQLAEAIGKQTGRANAIEKNEAVEAYRAARDGDGKAKKEAAQKHPELANAFALEQAVKSFAKQRLAPESQEKLVESIRATIEKDLAQGKKIPEVRLRQERDRKQEHGAER